jgi:surface polysaccharide O-acyltransferase-like enzyme
MTTQITTSALIPDQTKKIFYIDNLKILLTILVILHHAFITYGASGGWYYQQKTSLKAALIPMTIFVSVNQAFFMGFFFFLSAYFIRPSFEKKGALRFVTDRLKRLGIPLVFYSLVLSPVLSYLVYYFAKGHHITFLQYLGGFDGWIDFGVLWFVAALLIFTLLYVLWRVIFKSRPFSNLGVPDAGVILLFAAGVGMISFLVRVVFPVGRELPLLGFQLGHFTQYVTLFVLGLIASKNNWLGFLSYRTGKKLAIAFVLLLLFFPAFYIIQTKFYMPVDGYSGGFHWQALLYAVWEQMVGFAIIGALLCFGKKYWNRTSAFTAGLSRNTFAVYIFHPLVLISLSLIVRNWQVDPAIKLLVVGPSAVFFSFLLASFITKLPGVRTII